MDCTNQVESGIHVPIDGYLKDMNLNECPTEPCVYSSEHLIDGMYVDYLLFVGTETR